MSCTRRQVLMGGLAGLGWAGASWVVPKIARAGLPIPEMAGAFEAGDRQILAAAVDRLLPGAVEAGVPEYLDYWLVQKPFRSIRGYFAEGARHLDGMARQRYGKPFAGCSDGEQDAILAELAVGRYRAAKFNGAVFFQQLMELTLEGFFSDPRYGGNRNRAGWELIGIPDGLRSCWWNPHGVQRVLSPSSYTGLQD
ncbi:MAG: gluconate 2-dehydrogenase subunit 3 family protein [bacterium]